jgi:hypothetical protein
MKKIEKFNLLYEAGISNHPLEVDPQHKRRLMCNTSPLRQQM